MGKSLRLGIRCLDQSTRLRADAGSDPSVAIELHENAEAITAWRDTLPERQRKRLISPLAVTRRWKASTAHGNGKSPTDLKRDAVAAWRRFRSCLERLPATDAQPLWRLIAAEATTHVR